MYEIKMAFALIQVGTNFWVNPMQVTSVNMNKDKFVQICVASDSRCTTTDWEIERVKAALSPKAVSKAMDFK